MKRIVLFSIVLLVACTGVKFAPQEEQWYNEHRWIMEDFEKDLYFYLDSQGREEFQRIFWNSRDHWAKEIFEVRLKQVIYSDGIHSEDIRETILLHGLPFEVRVYYLSGEDDFGREVSVDVDREFANIQNKVRQYWYYLWEERRQWVVYEFKYRPPREWRRVWENNLPINHQFDEFDRRKYYGIEDKTDYYNLLLKCSIENKKKEKIYWQLKNYKRE